MSTAAQWNQKLAKYMGADTNRSVRQLGVTLGLFAALMMLAHVAHAWSPLLGLPLSMAAGMLVVKLFTIQHDCGHRSFFRNSRTCDLVGHSLSVLTLTPYDYWRRDHDRHHATSGDLDRRGHGDIMTMTVEEYAAMGWRDGWHIVSIVIPWSSLA